MDALDKSIALTTERHKRKRTWLAKSGGESATDEGRALLEYPTTCGAQTGTGHRMGWAVLSGGSIPTCWDWWRCHP